MALNLTTLLLVLAVTFMHSIFGFFSGVINVFCSIVSLVIALGFYEALNGFVTAQFGLHPGYTEPICLVVLFILSIVILRTVADNYIRGNVKLPMVVDWGGASACGFINAQIFIGVLVIGVQMLPLRNPEKGTVIGFATFARNLEERDDDHPDVAKFDRNHLWTRSDEFAVGLFKLISGGSMRGATTFASVYPDFSEAVFFSTNTPQPQSTPSAYRDQKEGDGFARGLKVEEWWEQRSPIEARYRRDVPSERDPSPDYSRQTFEVAAGKKLLGTLLVLNKSAADRDNRSFVHLFRPTMLRLVGKRGDTPEHHVPRVLANADSKIGGAPRIVDYDNNFSIPGQGNVRIYAFFEVDPEFEPLFVEYRRHARCAMPATALEQAPELALTMSGERDRGRGEGRGGDAGQTFGRVLESNSGDNATLPFNFAAARLRGASGVTLDGDKFASGRISGSRRRLEASGDEDKVTEFKLPEGRRLLQVRYKPRTALSIVGEVFNFAGQLNQYFVEDSNANSYPLAGYYAIVTRGSEEFVEVFFAGDPDEPTAMGYRNMLDFRDLERSEINDRDDTIIGLLFLVPPNTEFVKVVNQRNEGGEIRLRTRR